MGPFGSNIPVSCFVPSGIPVISGRHLHETRLFEDTFNFVSVEKADQLRRSNVQRGDIVFTHAGTIGQVSLVPENSKYERYIMSQRQFKLSVRRTEASPKFLVYYFKSDVGQRELFKFANQTGVPSLSRPVTNLRAIPINLPSLSEQEDIANILGLFDDRIDLLRQTNATLESIAQALFKSWFIDFDPVRAKAEGSEPEGMDAETAALFPDAFEESMLGLIPKEWQIMPFSDTVHVLGGGTPKTSIPDYWGGTIPWFSVVDAPTEGQVFTIATEKSVTPLGIENSSTRVLQPWTTIISARGTVGKLAMTGVAMAMNQSCYGLSPRLPGAEVSVYLSAQRLVDDLKRLAHGGVFDTITRDTLASVHVCRPHDRVLLAFENRVRPLFSRILANVSQVAVFEELRDTLLPRLISGKLRLPEAEAQLDEVLA